MGSTCPYAVPLRLFCKSTCLRNVVDLTLAVVLLHFFHLDEHYLTFSRLTYPLNPPNVTLSGLRFGLTLSRNVKPGFFPYNTVGLTFFIEQTLVNVNFAFVLHTLA